MVTPDESIPGFSAEYSYAQSIFYEQFNDVDFYVEDEEQENFYHRILVKLFPDIQLEKIFALRGKPNAIRHSIENQGDRKSVYLLDKDFDDLLGVLHDQANVFYLDRYCIENYLLEEKAIIEFVVEERPRLNRKYVERELKFNLMWDEVVKQLSKLFALFYIVHTRNVEALKYTSQKPNLFLKTDGNCCVDEQKVSDYAKQIKRRVKNQGQEIDVVNELKACAETFELDVKSNLRGTNVSGEYILALFAHRICNLFKLNHVPELNSFAFRLAKDCDFSSLTNLRKRVTAYLAAA